MNAFYFGVLVFYLLLAAGRAARAIQDYKVVYTAKKKLPPSTWVILLAFPFVFLFTIVSFPFELGVKIRL